MKNAKPVVTPALARNDDEEEGEASIEEHSHPTTHCGQESVLGSTKARHRFRHESLAKPSKAVIDLLRYLRGTTDLGLKLQVQNRACTTLTVFSVSDWAGDKPTRKSVCSWVVMLDGLLLSAGARTQSVIAQSSCEAEYIAATAATSEAKYIQALFLACGQHVNIHLRSDSTGAIGVASRRCLQRFRHLDGRFLRLQAETAAKRVRISKVPGPEKVADANTKPADRSSLEFCRLRVGVTEILKQFRDGVL